MRDDVSVRINLPEFRRQLQALGPRIERRIVTRGVRAAGKAFQVAARRLAPKLQEPDRRRRPGLLVSKIVVARSRFGRRGEVRYFVGVRAAKRAQRGTARDPFYWRFLEGGWIPRGRGQKFTGGERSRALQRRRALGAGGRRVAYPFLRPAFEQVGTRAVTEFNRVVEAGLVEINGGRA